MKFLDRFHLNGYFHQMVKMIPAMKSEGAEEVVERLRAILNGVSLISNVRGEGLLPGGGRADIEVELDVHGQPWKLLIEEKSSGEPRTVREGAWQLRKALEGMPSNTYGLLAAPFLSTSSQEILREAGFGWLDLAGNCRLAFGSVHIEIAKTARNPFSTKRSLKSLFAPKSARLLRLMLASPGPWKVTDLAARAKVSLGQVSKVRQALLDKEWAIVEQGAGLRLRNPGALLNAWREVATPPEVASREYTLVHGKELDTQLRLLFGRAQLENANIQLASYSAARWLAPFARVAGEFFYADSRGADLLQRHFRLEPAAKGENITIFKPVDDAMWDEGIVISRDLRGASLVQTYLDLWTSGERGRESAEHFRRETIDPAIKAVA